MKIEFLETYKHQGTEYGSGDRVTVDDVTGTALCDAGMASDLSGSVPTATRDPNRVITLDVENLSVAHTAEDLNHG